MSVYTPKQREAMWLWQKNELRRINIFEGSVSSGKTWISLVMWAFWVKTMPDDGNALYLMAGRSLTTLKRNCLLLLQELVGEANFTFTASSKEGRLFGRRILLEGANDAQAEAKIRGLTLQGAYIDEATKLPEDFFAMLLSRLRRPQAKLFGTTNPDAPMHWLKAKYLDRVGDLSILDLKFRIEDNTTLDPEYVEAIKKEYTGVFYERFILGNWTLAEGLIYPMFESAIKDPPRLPDVSVISPMDVCISVDYGTMNAFAAMLFVKIENTWYALREYYYSGRERGIQKTDEQYAQDIEAWCADVCPNASLRMIVDPSAASYIALMRKRGQRFKVIKAHNEVMDGIRETANALENGHIAISAKCVAWKREASGYIWDDRAADDAPVKVNDHLMDATRYFVKTMNIIRRARKP